MKKGSSLKAQAADIRKYADLKGFDLRVIHEDRGISGAKAKRPVIEGAIADVKAANGILIAASLDRVGRSIENLIQISNGLREAGCNFAAIRENIDTSTAPGRLYFHIISSFAEY